MKNKIKIFLDGIWNSNPVFRLVLGMCPILAVTNNVENSLLLGLCTMFVLVFSEIITSLIKNSIPDKIRIPVYIVIVATFVTICDLFVQAYFPSAYKILGLFIPLIVVNCIILGRIEAFSSKNTIFDSIIDSFGMGIGFTTALFILGSIREILGFGTFLGIEIFSGFHPITIMVLPSGAFIVLGIIIAFVNFLNDKIINSKNIRKIKNQETGA